MVVVENRGAVFPRSSKSSVSVRAINNEELGDRAIFHHLTGHYPWKPGQRADNIEGGYTLTEGLVLMLGLLARTLAPMPSRDNLRAVAEGIEAVGPEEATYSLGMAIHPKHPHRVPMALRFLLTEPKVTGRCS